MPKLSPEQEVIAAHMIATTAAFQTLVLCLQQNGALERGQFTEALRAYMESMKDKHPDVTLTLLDDLRQSLLD